MGRAAERLLEEALNLPNEERAELAVELIASLDGPTDQDVEGAWAAEIERRAAEYHAGRSEATDWAEVRRRVEQDLLGR